MNEILDKTLLTGLAIFALGGGCTLVVLFLRRRLSIQRERKHLVRLSNPGNVPSLFNLHIKTAQPDLQFKLFLGSGPLEEIPVPVEDPLLESMRVAEKPPALASMQPAQEKAAQPEPAAFKTNGNGKNVIQHGRTLAYGLERLGSFLPGEAGQWLRQQGQTVGKMQRGVTQVVQMQEHVKRKAYPRVKKPALPEAAQAEPARNLVSPPQNESAAKIIPSTYAAKTLPVQPGESVDLTLRITPANRRYLQGQFEYQIISHQQPLTPIEGIPGVMQKMAVVNFPPISRVRLWLPTLLSGFFILSTLLGIAFSIQFIWL